MHPSSNDNAATSPHTSPFPGRHLNDPRHPGHRLYLLAQTLEHNHPKMAEELRAQADEVAHLRPYTAYETLQNSRAFLQTRHQYGIGCRERNVWLSAVIGNLPSPSETLQPDEVICTISIACRTPAGKASERTEPTAGGANASEPSPAPRRLRRTTNRSHPAGTDHRQERL